VAPIGPEAGAIGTGGACVGLGVGAGVGLGVGPGVGLGVGLAAPVEEAQMKEELAWLLA